MKKIFIFGVFFISYLFSLEINPVGESREMQENYIFSTGAYNLNISNCGMFSKNNNIPGLEYPAGSNINYLYKAGLWVGGKKIRRNDDGLRYFWINYPPSNYDDYVIENSEEYFELIDSGIELSVIVDTLTSVGFDGDQDLKEFLPAYNSVEYLHYNQSQLNLWNDDVIAEFYGEIGDVDADGDGISDEDEFGRDFQFPDPLGTYLFDYPYDDDNDGAIDEDPFLNGVINVKNIFYDFSPFGHQVQRDYGAQSGMSEHYPLEIAVEQEIYSWSIEELSEMLIIKYTIHNCGIDPIYDMAVSFYNDADIGPAYWSSNDVAPDDISSYDSENEIAYSYDADGDGGLSTGYLGAKLIGTRDLNYDCFSWGVGDGPEDEDPYYFNPIQTSCTNEKYKIQNGDNGFDGPDEDNRFISLRDFPNAQTDEPNDTRFLYTFFGDQQGYDNQSEESFNLEAGESETLYLIIAVNNSVDEMINSVQEAENIISNGIDYQQYEDSPSIPVITSITAQNNSFQVNWSCFTVADEFKVWIKEDGESAANWTETIVNSENSSFTFDELEEDFYDIKISALFGDVYLESPVETIFSEFVVSVDEENFLSLNGNFLKQNYPNPFNPETKIGYTLREAGKVNLSVYNIKGQKVIELIDETKVAGNHSVVWNAKDSSGKELRSGVYFYKLEVNNSETQTRKMILLK